MKKHLMLLLALACLAWKDKSYTLYEIGRPASIEYNNAKRTVGKYWGINWVYADDELLREMGYEKIGSHNDSVMALLAKAKGKDWESRYYGQVQEEMALQDSLRSKIKSKSAFKDIEQKTFEPIILFERRNRKSNKKWEVHIVGQLKEDESRRFMTLCNFKMQTNKGDFEMDCREQPLTIVFPQNGLR